MYSWYWQWQQGTQSVFGRNRGWWAVAPGWGPESPSVGTPQHPTLSCGLCHPRSAERTQLVTQPQGRFLGTEVSRNGPDALILPKCAEVGLPAATFPAGAQLDTQGREAQAGMRGVCVCVGGVGSRPGDRARTETPAASCCARVLGAANPGRRPGSPAVAWLLGRQPRAWGSRPLGTSCLPACAWLLRAHGGRMRRYVAVQPSRC